MTGLIFSTALVMFAVSFLIQPKAVAFTTGYRVVHDLHLIPGKQLSFSEGRSSGHEEITRQALLQVKDILIESHGIDAALGNESLLGDLDPQARGTIGATTANRIINGNYCTDAPHEPTASLSLTEFWFKQKVTHFDWHNDPRTQVFHFLRNYNPDGSLVSARQACMDSTTKIIEASQSAAKAWQMGKKAEALFLIGHASHIIQDSFSPAHALRDNKSANNDLIDICYYGSKQFELLKSKGLQNSVCYHAKVDLEGDGVWNRTAQQIRKTQEEWPDEDSKHCTHLKKGYIFKDADKRSCLKHEARLARTATVKYLYILATDFQAHRVSSTAYDQVELDKLAARLKSELFEGPSRLAELNSHMPNGIARCEQLRD